MLGEAPKSVTTGIPGWEQPSEEMLLIELARKYVPDNGIIVELGGETGRSAGQFLYATIEKENVIVHTIDLFPTDHHDVGDLMKAQRDNIREALPSESYRHVQIRSISWEAADIFDGMIDLLFIDAGHTYQDVQKDIAAWHGKVKEGGVIVFHDYARNEQSHYLHWEVKRAVDEFFISHKDDYLFFDGDDSIVYMVKKEKSVLKKVVESVKEIVNPKEDIDKTIEYEIENVHTLNAKEAQRVREITEENKPAQPKKKGRPAKQ